MITQAPTQPILTNPMRNLCNIIFIIYLFVVEVVIIGCFAQLSYIIYPYGVNPNLTNGIRINARDNNPFYEENMQNLIFYRNYLYFVYINTFCLIGFSFLTVYLRFHRWSSLGFTYLSIALGIQLYLLFIAFWIRVNWGGWKDVFQINLIHIMCAIKGAVALVIVYGALLGKVDAFQMTVIAVIFMFLYTLNEFVVCANARVRDIGGCFTIHAFAAFFALSCSWIYSPKANCKDNPNNRASYGTATLAFLGTFFLWIMFPAFNAISHFIELGTSSNYVNFAAPPTTYYSLKVIAIMNTFWALTASNVCAFLISFIVKGGKFSLDHVLNATISGGVAIAASADLFAHAVHPMYIGGLAGIISTLCMNYLTPIYEMFYFFDTRSVFNVHGIPSLIGAIASSIAAACTVCQTFNLNDRSVEGNLFYGRSAYQQGGYQFLGWLISAGIGLGGGIIMGLLLRIWRVAGVPEDTFGDHIWWKMSMDRPNEMKPVEQIQMNPAQLVSLNQ